MKRRRFPWKKSFIKLPSLILKKLGEIDTTLVVVAETKVIPISDIAKGQYKHVGLAVENGEVVTRGPTLPPASSGNWSRRNVEGWERKRRDLPKITKTYSWETPNFGDAATYGTHTTWRDREVYQVEFDEPRAHRIIAEVLKTGEGNPPSVVVRFAIKDPIDRSADSFEKELLWALNVLQENTGVAGVYPSNATRQDYLGTIALDWEIFPPGTVDEVVASIREKRLIRSTDAGAIMEQRIRLFSSLKPTAYLAGRAGFSAYIGAQFAPDLVVFENVRYGNALYVLYENWEEVSKRSRIDLLRGTSEKFDRFVHSDGWEERFLNFLRAELAKRKPKRK